MDTVRLGIIGLDSSHAIVFTSHMQGEVPPGERVENLRVVKAMRFASPFQTEEGQDKRQAQLEKMGVKVGTSLEETLKDVDGVMIEINDPAQHLHYFERVAKLAPRLPVFLDKPLASNVEDGRRIIEIAKKSGIKAWSSSSLRFTKNLEAACAEVTNPILCHAYGALGIAPAGSSLVWYGVHVIEMIERMMGRGAKSVFARKDARGVVLTIAYADGRRAVAECNEGVWPYGGRIQSKDKLRQFTTDGESIYFNLMGHVREFFVNGTIPVGLEDTLEVQAILNAGDRSFQTGREEALQIE